jgi:hypothetical protein
MRQIITLQMGRESNFTMAHFWNLQDELLKLDPDLSTLNEKSIYYESESTGIRYPLALLFDHKDNFGYSRGNFGEQEVVPDESVVETW